MITQWDIVSSIRPSDNAILYALLIDGTEHDARLIAKKLKGYVRQPQPAMAPYVYSFPLPEDLDENTLEKIREIKNYSGHPYEFYQKCGYQIVGVLPDVNGPGKPDIFMAKRLMEE